MSEPSDYEVVAIRFGTRVGTRAEIFLNHHLYGEPDGPLQMDYFFWLVRNRDRTVLVDCGFSPRGGATRGRTELIAPIEALRALGTDPADVGHVVVTHAHYDHIGNLGLFPEAEVVVAEDELAFWTGPWAAKRQFAHSVEPDEIDVLRACVEEGRARLVRGEAQIAPGIRAIQVGGHTPGQLLVLVETRDGRTLLTSDAVHYYEEVELDRPYSGVADLPAMYRGFEVVREIQSQEGTAVVAGHDPAVTDRFPALDATDRGEIVAWKVG